MVEFLQFLLRLCKKINEFVVSIPGAIAAALSGIGAFVSACWQNLNIVQPIVRLIDSASTLLNSLSPASIDSTAGQYLLYVSAVDTLVGDALLSLSASFGVVILVLVSMVVAVLGVFAAVFTIRLGLRLVQLFSLGMANP